MVFLLACALAVSGAWVVMAGLDDTDIASSTPPSNPATMPKTPTIVSLNPCTDAILAQVADPGQLLAISSYSHDPVASSMDIAVARRFRAVSGSVEEVAAIGPQVVVASTFLDPASFGALNGLGFRVVRVPIASDIASTRKQVRELASLAGHPERGEALVAQIDEALARAAPPSGWKPVPALVWQSGGLVAGNATLIADMMRRAGFENAVSARGLGQADYLPLESVLADPPRIIFSIGNPKPHGQDDEYRMLRHPSLKKLVRTTYFKLDHAALWCGGPTVPRVLGELAAARHELRQP
ncbi:ABC transporter substrate-binding protein [Novosphingobium clariflavum]|mgnify:CR=1 FL=1|uniref:ABC transporter substrate-binding protein n=1 Tax=Novosphingobium clariflavum TaxID=2029884 RepID=A0ABV6SEN7_9SPHN|nr:ABC transporter substrate-binding protein [Novosphingobium clariflavum]